MDMIGTFKLKSHGSMDESGGEFETINVGQNRAQKIMFDPDHNSSLNEFVNHDNANTDQKDIKHTMT